MSLLEVAWRLEDQVNKWSWSRYQVAPEQVDQQLAVNVLGLPATYRLVSAVPRFTATLPPNVIPAVPAQARDGVISSASEVLRGQWDVLGVTRKDMYDPDWFFDPVTGRSAPQSEYCFRVDFRSEEATGNVKQVWELSRMQHVTVLATAFALSGEDRYAERAAQHLRSWWHRNPFLSGVHWTSGIELGLRLIAWVWARRLLDGWEGAATLFEENSSALEQISWHQRYLARFRSRGSSANNHVIAEAAGQLVASLAFNWFEESDKWAAQASALLEQELARNTFPSGLNREMAFEYHGFVAELGLLAAVEADLAGRPLRDRTWQLLAKMLDVVAATVDSRSNAPRQGDGDDGRGLVLGPPEANRWETLLALGQEVFGAAPWWPATTPDAASVLVGSLSRPHDGLERSPRRPSHFADAGMTIIRSHPGDGPEIWCRCDAGPHGFLSIAAHAHADALAVEVHHDGTEILADPGTYCYQGEPTWRSYFRSTLGHNTVEIGHQDQSTSGGSTMWTRHAHSRLLDLEFDEAGQAVLWSAEHDGYTVLDPPAHHRRTVNLSQPERRIYIRDVVKTSGSHPVRLAFHLGPEVYAEMATDGGSVRLAWENGNGSGAKAVLLLPDGMRWSIWHGEMSPVLGWYSEGFGQKSPSISIIGEGVCSGSDQLTTVLQFED
jgi:hypothetical protein